MHLKKRLARIALILLGFAAVLFLIFLDSGQSAQTRTFRLKTTAAEIRRGNYYAWGQLVLWLEKLSPAEKVFLKDACADYARSQHLLHVAGSQWPPQGSPPRSHTAGDWMREVMGMDDNSLEYDVAAYAMNHDIEVGNFQAVFESSMPPLKLSAPLGAALRPSAAPGR